MKTCLLTLAIGAVASIALANEMTSEQCAAFRITSSRRTAHLGGTLIKPGSQQGRILFVNAQKIVPQTAFTNLTVELAALSRLNIAMIRDEEKITPMNAAARKTALKADIVVFLTECDKCETMLLNAPESGWAIVNATAVTKDARNDVFKAARLRKELARAFYSVAGAMNSQYPGSLMGCVRKASDLDKLVEEIPMDVYGRTVSNLRGMGVTPVAIYTYKRACEEGWAPAPTNDVQKAIWEKVHALPTAPITIKPETKKVER